MSDKESKQNSSSAKLTPELLQDAFKTIEKYSTWGQPTYVLTKEEWKKLETVFPTNQYITVDSIPANSYSISSTIDVNTGVVGVNPCAEVETVSDAKQMYHNLIAYMDYVVANLHKQIKLVRMNPKIWLKVCEAAPYAVDNTPGNIKKLLSVYSVEVTMNVEGVEIVYE